MFKEPSVTSVIIVYGMEMILISKLCIKIKA